MDESFPLLRASLDPEYAQADPVQLGHIVRAIYGPAATPEDVEGVFDDISRGFKKVGSSVGGFAQQAAPALQGALPSVARGAAGGAAFGPWGALIGGVAGAASGLLQQSKDPTARAVGGAIHTAGNLVSTVRGGGGAMGALGTISTGALGASPRQTSPAVFSGGGGAANALLGMLSRPETLQALLASAIGAFGRGSVPVGAQNVPVHAMLSGLGAVAGRAAHEAAEREGENAAVTPPYVIAAGEAVGIDTDDAEGRTDALLTLLALSPSIWAQQRPVVVNVASDPQAVPAISGTAEATEADEASEVGEGLEADEAWDETEDWPEFHETEWDEADFEADLEAFSEADLEAETLHA